MATTPWATWAATATPTPRLVSSKVTKAKAINYPELRDDLGFFIAGDPRLISISRKKFINVV